MLLKTYVVLGEGRQTRKSSGYGNAMQNAEVRGTAILPPAPSSAGGRSPLTAAPPSAGTAPRPAAFTHDFARQPVGPPPPPQFASPGNVYIKIIKIIRKTASPKTKNAR